jgi:hypothetical protein
LIASRIPLHSEIGISSMVTWLASAWLDEPSDQQCRSCTFSTPGTPAIAVRIIPSSSVRGVPSSRILSVSRTIVAELQQIIAAITSDNTGSIHAMCVNRIIAPPTITAAVDNVSPSICRNTERIFTSPENFHSSPAIAPFISTPAAATYIIIVGWTVTGAYNLWIAEIPIQAASTIRVSAFTNAASTPAR